MFEFGQTGSISKLGEYKTGKIKTNKVNYEDCHNITKLALDDLILDGHDKLELEFNPGRIDITNVNNNTKGYALTKQWTYEEIEENDPYSHLYTDDEIYRIVDMMNTFYSDDTMYYDATHIANILHNKGYKDVSIYY